MLLSVFYGFYAIYTIRMDFMADFFMSICLFTCLYAWMYKALCR